MVYQEILSYIRQKKAGGASDEQIRQELLDAGWRQVDVKIAFNVVGNMPEKQVPQATEALTQEEHYLPEPPKPIEIREKNVQPQERVFPQKSFPARILSALKRIAARITGMVPSGKSYVAPSAFEVPQKKVVLPPASTEQHRELPQEQPIEKPSERPKQATAFRQQNPFRPAVYGKEETKKISVQKILEPEKTEQKTIPLFYESWLPALTNPAETLRKEAYYASFERTTENLVAAGIIVLIPVLLSNILGQSVLKTILSTVFEIAKALGYGVAIVFTFTLAVFVSFIWFNGGVIYSALAHAFAKLVGGKGSLSKQIHLFSVVSAGASVMLIVTSVIATILSVFLGTTTIYVAAFLTLVIGTYSFLIMLVVLKELHEISLAKAFFAAALPAALVMAMAVAIIYGTG